MNIPSACPCHKQNCTRYRTKKHRLRPSESFKFVTLASNKLMSQNGADLMKSPGFHFAEASLLPLKYF